MRDVLCLAWSSDHVWILQHLDPVLLFPLYYIHIWKTHVRYGIKFDSLRLPQKILCGPILVEDHMKITRMCLIGSLRLSAGLRLIGSMWSSSWPWNTDQHLRNRLQCSSIDALSPSASGLFTLTLINLLCVPDPNAFFSIFLSWRLLWLQLECFVTQLYD